MRRTWILGIVLSLILVLVSAAATLTLARNPGEVHHGSMGATTWFAPPNHPDMMVEAVDIQRSPVGPYDFLSITILPDVMVIVTDNDDLADFIDDLMFGGMPVTTRVQDEELEVWRKDKNLFAELTVEVEPVGKLSVMFEGIGSAKSEVETDELPGVTMTARWTGFNAFVTVVAHVGTSNECEQMTLGFMATQMRMTMTATSP